MAEPTEIRTLDTVMLGEPGITGAFLVRSERTALVETGPRSTVEEILKGLADAGVEYLDAIVVTHVHLDHAGAAGTLASLFRTAVVAVHEIGAPHLVDPAKLWSSATRIYGVEMERMWGGIDPLPAERMRPLSDGDVIDLGGASLRALATPGHASHHHAFLEESTGTLFAGDALGVRLPDVGVARPATPPPEFDLEQSLGSIERLAGLGAERIVLTHFGDSDAGAGASSPAEMCERAAEALRRWVEWVRRARTGTEDIDAASQEVRKAAAVDLESSLDETALTRLEKTTSTQMNTWGVMRYLTKKERLSG